MLQASHLPLPLLDKVLNRMGLPAFPEPTLETLKLVYAKWCQRIPFDNVQKLIHVRNQNAGPLPGSDAASFFEAWLQHGTGGTCWSGSAALYALLKSIGFEVERGIATMLAAADIPPNHATLRVKIGEAYYLVDSSILHHEPLRLRADRETLVPHPAWGIQCVVKDLQWHLQWRPLHRPDGFECRIESFEASKEDYLHYYDATRNWSPFNYQLCARINSGHEVAGIAYGNAIAFTKNGSVITLEVDDHERRRILIEKFGMSEEIVSQLPADLPTPSPPSSRTATTMMLAEAVAAL